MNPDLPPPTLVQDARGLERLLGVLERERDVAVDTEADSFFSHREKVCLLQITAGGLDFLVDPLAGFDITPIGAMLADERKTKVFHDGEYDILILKRDYRFRFKNLFDTRVAAATLGSQAPGLASVLREHFGVELDKSMQRSNWSLRPLTEKQVRYARLDTHFLLPLMERQREELERRGRLMIVIGECARLEDLEPGDASFDPDEFVRIKGARALSPLDRQVLRELFILREKFAAASDQPPFRIVNSEVLLEIARIKPRYLAELGRVHGFSHKQVHKMGEEVLAAIQRAQELGPLKKLPELESRDGTGQLSEEEVELHERLKNWRRDEAQREGFDSALLLNRMVLLALAKQRPTTLDAMKRIPGLHDWQFERYGKALIELIRRFEADLAGGQIVLKRRFRPRA